MSNSHLHFQRKNTAAGLQGSSNKQEPSVSADSELRAFSEANAVSPMNIELKLFSASLKRNGHIKNAHIYILKLLRMGYKTNISDKFNKSKLIYCNAAILFGAPANS